MMVTDWPMSHHPPGPYPVVVPGLTDKDMWWLNGQLKLVGDPTIWFYRDYGSEWSRLHQLPTEPK